MPPPRTPRMPRMPRRRVSVPVLATLLAACAPPARPNILLVSLDTVRADHTTPYGSAADTTPVLARLAAEGTLYANAFSQGNESAYSHAALFTGRYASELAAPVYATYALPEGAALVSESLRASGYRTAMFSAGGHVTGDFGFDQGWDHFSAEPGFASLFDTGPKATAWIAATDAPWFVFLHSYDAHRPYTRPGPWDHLYADATGSPLAEAICRSPCLSEMVLRDALLPELLPAWFTHGGGAKIMDTDIYARLEAAAPDALRVPLTAADRAHVVAHYDGALRYADTLLGATLAALDLENTVVIVVSDHGEDLLDHGYMNHRTGLHDSCTKVPLVAWGPGFTGGRREEGLVDGRDVAATVLALAGAPEGGGGRDLRAVGTSPVDAVYSEGVMDMVSVRTATHRLVYRDAPLVDADYVAKLRAEPVASPRFALYDVRTDAEPMGGELTDPVLTASLRDRLVSWRSGLRIGDHALAPEAVSPEVSAALREHGYWAAPAGTDAAGIDASCRDRLLFGGEP